MGRNKELVPVPYEAEVNGMEVTLTVDPRVKGLAPGGKSWTRRVTLPIEDVVFSDDHPEWYPMVVKEQVQEHHLLQVKVEVM